jgi:MFS family permease
MAERRAADEAQKTTETTADPEQRRPWWILPVIIVSEFAGTSLWFASNAVLGDLQQHLGLASTAVGDITSAVQLGFIAGTLVFAFFAIADQFSPRIVFFVSSLVGALCNLAVYQLVEGLWSLLVLRFATGFFLAGIYPVGMKIAAGWYQKDLGNAIGFLVGALVLGTAFPHLLKSLGASLPWETVVIAVSTLAALGGVLMLTFVPDGPHLAKTTKFDPRALALVFQSPRFRASALGYFGHMWELYALWAFVPLALAAHAAMSARVNLNVSLWAFCIIAAGSIGCAGGGLASRKLGSARVAFAQLAASGICCVLSPLLLSAPTPVMLALLLFWGIAVVGDSPQFSALNAENAPRALVGSALTIVNCIGFSITIVSLQVLNYLAGLLPMRYVFLPLAIGPALGLLAMAPLVRGIPRKTAA